MGRSNRTLRSLRHHPVGPPRCRDRSSPHGLGYLHRVRCGRPVSPLWVRRSHCAVAFRPGRVVFPTDRRGRVVSNSPRTPLTRFRRPPGSCPDDVGRLPSGRRLLPGAFVPDGTCGARGLVHAGVACPPPSARRVWLPSRRFAPSRALPALFRAGGACGVRSSEPSPPAQWAGIPADFAPRAVTAGLAATSRSSSGLKPADRLPGTATRESLAARRVFSPTGDRMLP